MIICFFSAPFLTEPDGDYEQLATNYFFTTVWAQKYQQYKSVEFESKTDTSIFVGHIYGCRKWDGELKKKIAAGKVNKVIQLKPTRTNVSIKKKGNTRRLKLFIGTKIHVNDHYIVQIEVYKPFEFVDHYFIEFDKEGKIVDTCEFNEII